MNEELFKQTVAKNLIAYRKASNLTQLDLANKLNYSDKAISKWERGESIPDAYTLQTIADLYGITLNDLCGITSNTLTPNNVKKNKHSIHMIIASLSIGLVWFIATICYSIAMMVNESYSFTWLAFIYAIPVSFIVLVVLSSIWFKKLTTTIAISGLLWGVALSFHLTCTTVLPINGAYLSYIIAIPFQILVLIWYIMILIKNKK